MTTSELPNTATCIELQISGPGEARRHSLQPGNATIIGSGPSCGLRLSHDEVGVMHCVLRYETDGQLWLQPWGESKTFLDGQLVEDETAVRGGQKIKAGPFRIVAMETAAAPVPPPALQPEAEPAQPTPAVETSGASTELSGDLSDAPIASRELAAAPTDQGAGDVPASDQDVKQAPDSVAASDSLFQVEDDFEQLWGEEFDAEPLPAAESFLADEDYQQRIEALEAEVQQLQGELLERELQLQSPRSHEQPAADVAEQPDTVPAQRFEAALQELERCDRRIKELESLLCLAEEAQQAEKEERELIEAWVGEIEGRANQREEERQLENRQLQQQLKQSRAECQQLAKRSERANAAQQGDSAKRSEPQAERSEPRPQSEPASQRNEQLEAERLRLQTQSDSLRQELDTLRGQLDEASQQRDQLSLQLQLQNSQSEPPDVQAKIDELLRAERLEMAQERATVARQRAELTRLQSELDRQQLEAEQAGKTGSEIDSRIHAFREHLKELNEESPAAAPANSLGARLSRLWKRFE